MAAVFGFCTLISIHALREEGDLWFRKCPAIQNKFLSTPSARRATRRYRREQIVYRISIHALREEGDAVQVLTAPRRNHFYPRPPRGGRLAGERAQEKEGEISIHALREEGDLALHDTLRDVPVISIHALREEGDGKHPTQQREDGKFLSTPSARRATWRLMVCRLA